MTDDREPATTDPGDEPIDLTEVIARWPRPDGDGNDDDGGFPMLATTADGTEVIIGTPILVEWSDDDA